MSDTRVGGRPLALRLAMVLATSVIIVLLATGIVVNRVVDRSIADSLNAVERTRLELAVTAIENLRGDDRPFADRGVSAILRRIANLSGGQASLVEPDGTVVAREGRAPPGGDVLVEPLSAGSGGGSIEIRAPRVELPFLRTFNLALIMGGVVSVLAIVGVAAFSADRMTRPLRALADAAGRLGAGDLGVRATGGPDRESSELAAAFNEMADQLERSEALRRRAASDIAHDLATPATVLESQLQAMIDGVVPNDRDELERARAAAASLSGVVAQLGELAGAEAATLNRQPQVIDLRDLAERVVASVEAMLRDRGVRATVAGSGTATADALHIERAIRNVVANAIGHGRADDRIRITIANEAGSAVVRVADSGPGIAQADAPHIFERFYRADRARRSAGSGLGLTIARELIAANAGSIAVESTGPQGTTFVIRLPAA